jgi:hypothetical protein
MFDSGRNKTTSRDIQLGMRLPRVDDIEKAPDRVVRLLALALQARDAGQIRYAKLLEQQALRASAEPDGWKPGNALRPIEMPPNAKAWKII